jgi:two-component system sensor histidine kinase DctS
MKKSHFRLAGPWRWLVPILLVLLFVATLLWLPWQARQMESNERQEQLIADTLWVEQTIRFQFARTEENLAAVGADIVGGMLAPHAARERLRQLQANARELHALTWLDEHGAVSATTHSAPVPGIAPAPGGVAPMKAGDARSPVGTPPSLAGAAILAPSAAATIDQARKIRRAQYGEAYGKGGSAALDYYLPLFQGERFVGTLVATFDTKHLLDEMVPWWFAQDNQITLTDRDDKVVAQRAAAGPGHGVYTHKRALDLPGANLMLSTDSVKSAPRLLPNLLVGSVIVLALGLAASLAALWRHISRRLAAEGALRQQMAFRTAMEDSLVTGLRARDLEGRVTYVNPAFCQIVGLPQQDLVGKLPPMPYWAPEAMADYQKRFAEVLSGTVTPQFETVFQRPDGQRVPVLIFEAPLVDSNGKQTGWMGSILDISDRKRVEELNRQQQEKLQLSARLATMGEISSMLAHELNQPLAAISSYASGALNVVSMAEQSGTPVDSALLRPALEQASAQAQRAGQVIRSVHAFVKKREPRREPVDVAAMVEGIRALLEMQARRFFVAIQTEISADLPTVSADRMMIEQVLLNLTRNAIDAMQDVAAERRLLRIVAGVFDGMLTVSVIDHGHGINPEVAERLFSPFFSTKAEGMGMGLSICRTAIEFHGGQLEHRPNPGGGTVFTFTLPLNETGD